MTQNRLVSTAIQLLFNEVVTPFGDHNSTQGTRNPERISCCSDIGSGHFVVVRHSSDIAPGDDKLAPETCPHMGISAQLPNNWKTALYSLQFHRHPTCSLHTIPATRTPTTSPSGQHPHSSVLRHLTVLSSSMLMVLPWVRPQRM